MNDKAFRSWEDAVRWLKHQPDQQELVFASYYDEPLCEAAERYYCSDEWQEIQGMLLRHQGAALDVGAGRGIASYALAKSGFQVTALEPDLSDLVGAGAIKALTEESGLPISVCVEFSERLPFEDCSFDVVFARAVLHHMKDLQAGCAEISRVLKPGGVFIAVREHVISKKEDLQAFLDIHPLHHLYGGEHAYILEEYREAIEKSGLKIYKQLNPLCSAVNYAPYTKDTLKLEIAAKLPKPLSFLMLKIFRSDTLFAGVTMFLTWLDHRPGRLYSFVAYKEDV